MFVPRSHVPGQRWPALHDPAAAAMMSLLFQLDDTQWWAPDRLLAAQLDQLAPLLEHARQTVPGYRKLMKRWRGGLDGIAVLDRARLQGAAKAFRSRAYPKHHGPLAAVTTSGSTGRPVEVLHSDIHRAFWDAFTLRNEVWHGRDLRAKMAIIRHMPEGRALPPNGDRSPTWSPVLDRVTQTGPSVTLALSAPIDVQAAWLHREQPDYLLTFPTNLHALARHLLDHDQRLPLGDVATLGESLSDDTRALCREAFGARVIDMYSSQEFGYLALQCPEHDRYHVMSESVLVEVLDSAGAPVPPGGVGRVVVTSLTNWASPLIRYEIGDWAEVGAPCPCGRGLPVLTRILGRTRNMLRRPDGVVRWPYIESSRCLAAAPYRQMQLAQTSLDAIEVRIVPRGRLTEAHRTALTEVLHRSLGYPFSMTFVEVEAISRSAAGKFEEFVSLVERAGG